MSNILRLPQKVRPLRSTYQPDAPYVVEREDDDDGGISYEVADSRPDSYRLVCIVPDCGHAKHDAELIARGLNLLVQYGLETLPKMKG